VLAVLASWLPIDQALGQGEAAPASILREMASTVLPGYLGTTIWLGLLVALGAAIVGTGTAAAVTLFDFRAAAPWSGCCCCRWPCRPM
jgi:iron(III) transport system permease protein